MTFLTALTYLPAWFLCPIAFVLGACIGSFLNVIIYRIPIGPQKRASGQVFNINAPRSHCPICKHQLAWYENIPLVSWLIQGAKCKNCKTTIPARYPAIELLVAVIVTAAWALSLSLFFSAIAMALSMALVPAIWWLVTKTPWNRFMAVWCFSFLLASMVIGGCAT